MMVIDGVMMVIIVLKVTISSSNRLSLCVDTV